MFGIDEKTFGKPVIGVDESCDGMFKALAVTTKPDHGGKLLEGTKMVIDWEFRITGFRIGLQMHTSSECVKYCNS